MIPFPMSAPSLKTLVIIPTYQELNNLRELLPLLFARQPDLHLLLIDDASGDHTPAWLRARPEYGTTLFLIERPGKLGLGTAYREGFAWALQHDYHLIFEMDADFSHDPAEIAPMRKQAETIDIVIGSRYLDGVRVLNWPISRLLLSLGAAHYVRWLTGMPLTDPTSGYKCFRREVLETIDLSQVRSTGYAFQIEMNFLAWRQGFRLAEVPITFVDRHSGTSKMSPHIAREAIWEVLRLAAARLLSPRKPTR